MSDKRVCKIAAGLAGLLVPISKLKLDPSNARRHGPADLAHKAAALQRFGQQKPVVISAAGVVIAGNGIFQAAGQLGWTHIAAVRTALKGAEVRAYAIADNRTGELSEWDEDRLAEQLRELAAAKVDLDALGFTTDELADVLHEAQADEGPPAADAADEEPPRSRRGEVYRLGRHRLICGDATDAGTYQRLLGRRRAALAVTSPPYGVGKCYEEHGIEPWFSTVRPVIEQLCRRAEVVVWNIGDLYATGSQHIEPTFAHSLGMFAEHGFRPLWIRIWLKQGMNFGVAPYHLVSTKPVQQYEYVGAFGTDEEGAAISREDFCGTDFEWIVAMAGAKYRYVRRLSPRQRRDWGYAGVWQMNTVAANDEHPAMFPVELPLRAVLMHSDAGETVMEPFCGSGTTIIAAERTGRACMAVEISERFCDVARRRWAQEVHGEGCDWAELTPAAVGRP
jgi:DNA modification methylase